jgi:uncharacterized membrane protein
MNLYPEAFMSRFSPLQRVITVYGGFIVLMVGNYFFIGLFQTEPLILSVVGERWLGVIDGAMFLMYVALTGIALWTIGNTIKDAKADSLSPEGQLAIVQSVLILVIAHILLLYIPLFTGLGVIPVLY